MKYLASLLLCLLLFDTNAQIENNLTPIKSDYSIGALTGTSQGLGLAVRYWPKNVGLQVSFLPIYTEYTSMISLGVSGLFMLKQYGDIDFYLTVGTHNIITDYNRQTVFGIEPSVGLNSDDGTFTFFGSLGYNYSRNSGSMSIYPGAAIGVFINL